MGCKSAKKVGDGVYWLPGSLSTSLANICCSKASLRRYCDLFIMFLHREPRQQQ